MHYLKRRNINVYLDKLGGHLLMMIKKRLTISNILMLLVPAILIVTIAGGVLEGFAEIYGKKIKVLDENNGTYYVQKVLNSYSRNLRIYNKENEEDKKD